MPRDSKQMAALILDGGKGSKDGAPPGDGDGAGADEGLHASAEDLISAVHAKDAAGVVDALRSALTMLDAEEPMPDEGPAGGAPPPMG